MSKFAVILPAAGKSSRFGDKNYKKPFVPLDNKAVWLHAAERFLDRRDVCQTIVVIAAEDREFFQMKFGANIALLGIELVEGGAERSDSVENALARLKPEVEFVAVHDAARPCIADVWINQVFGLAEQTGAALLAIPVTGTLKRSSDGRSVSETVSRSRLWEAQTPQVFRRDWIERAYRERGDRHATDDAELVEQIGCPVTMVQGSPLNLKVTCKADLPLAAAALKALPKPRLSGGGNPLDDLWR